MITQKNNILWHKYNAVSRYLLAHLFSGFMPYYVVNEYPKSGGSWLATMLADALDVPFPRNRLPMFRSSVLHGHMMHGWNLHNLVLLWRDGRDVLVSQYYHWLFENDRGNKLLVEKSRKALGFADYENIQANLLPFMEYIYENQSQSLHTWPQFVDRWYGREDVISLHYEKLLASPAAELQRVYYSLTHLELSDETAEMIAGRYSFRQQHGREPGEEKRGSFARKGIAGDWKNHFSAAACQRFSQYAGNALVKLGYEKDTSWVAEGKSFDGVQNEKGIQGVVP